MALNAVCNERLARKETLLTNLVHIVGVVLDIGKYKQSLYSSPHCLSFLHTYVKAILKHGTKIRHHLIFGKSSFAEFDNWLESRIIENNLIEDVRDLEFVTKFYYDWAFLWDSRYYLLFADTLHVLATRDIVAFTILEVKTSHLVTTMMEFESSPRQSSLVEESTSNFNENEKSENNSIKSSTNASQEHSTDTNKPNAQPIPMHIPLPPFNYATTSPVSSFNDTPSIQSEVAEVLRPEIQESDSNANLPLPSTSTSVQEISITADESDSDSDNLSQVTNAPSFLESGGMIHPPALGHFPLPRKGQSLTNFLSSLSDTMPELDRENAHFNVSEALISAFEKIRVQRVKLEREMFKEDVFGTVEEHVIKDSPSAKKNIVGLKEISKFKYSRPVMHTETEESELEYWRHSRRPPPNLRKKAKKYRSGASDNVVTQTDISSNASLSSLDEDVTSSSFSAETVAMSLLRNSQVKGDLFPSACELQWFVTEGDVPQSLLPLPKYFGTTSASDSETDNADGQSVGKLDQSMRLRGTVDWAPPRPQIIFTLQPSPNIKILNETQRFRCAGCGMRVDPKYASTFRYCFYLGRYFCTGCHTGKKHRIPQMVLHKWDFGPYLVSNFSASLLESLYSDPVYNIIAINSNLLKKVKLNNFRNYRIQLGFIHEYLKNCKSAEKLYKQLLKLPTYYIADVDLCSLEDLVNVRFSCGLPIFVKDFVAESVHHILHCTLCRNLGFICEICSRNEVLFPFQINRVSRCYKCSSCFHLKCFNSTRSACPKCMRVSSRRVSAEVSPAAIAV